MKSLVLKERKNQRLQEKENFKNRTRGWKLEVDLISNFLFIRKRRAIYVKRKVIRRLEN